MLGQFTVLAGTHTQNDPEMTSKRHPHGVQRTYIPGDKFWGDVALFSKWPEKFRKVEGAVVPEGLEPEVDKLSTDGLEQKSLGELKAIADGMELSYPDTVSKADLVEGIRSNARE